MLLSLSALLVTVAAGMGAIPWSAMVPLVYYVLYLQASLNLAKSYPAHC